jgi:hypothetical protein
MEEKKEIFENADETFKSLVDLKSNFERPVLGPSLINIFESVSKFNEENKNFITNLYKPHESVYEDVISSFENPNCTCRKRFIDFIENNIEISKNVFFSLLAFLSKKDCETILDRLKSFYKHYKTLSEEQNAKKTEEKNSDLGTAGGSEAGTEQLAYKVSQENVEAKKGATAQNNNSVEASSYIGRSFIIEKTQEAYASFFETLLKDKIQYNGISVMPYNLNQMMIVFY